MNSVPNLRFKEFSGEWESQPLSKLGTFFKGTGLSKADLSDEGNPCVLYGELYTKYTEVIANVKSKTNVELGNAVIGKINDVLIPSSGETAVDIATASCLQQDDVILGGDLNVFRSNQVNGIFTSYQLNTSKKFEIAKLAQGASVVHVYNDQLKKLKLSVPTIEEQEKIASFFSLIEKKIELQTEKVEELKNYKKGIMQKIFSQELRFKDENGDEYPEWEEKRLGEFCYIQGGYAFKSDEFVDSGVPIIRITNVDSIVNVLNNQTVYSKVKNIEEKFWVRNGDLLIAMSGATTGKTGKYICDELAYLNQRVGKFVVKEGTNFYYTFLYAIVETSLFYQQLMSSLVAGAQPNISPKDIEEIKFKIPSIDEQKKISELLISIDQKNEKEQEKLNYLIQYKKGLLQQMFI